VFVDYLDGKVSSLPWCDKPVESETLTIKDKLRKLNENGFLTINSQV